MRALRGVLTTRGRAFFGSGIVLCLAGIVFGFPDLTRFGVLVIALPVISGAVVPHSQNPDAHRATRLPRPGERGPGGQGGPVVRRTSRRPRPRSSSAEERLDYALGDRPRFRRRPASRPAACAPSTTWCARRCGVVISSAPSGCRCTTLSASPTATPCSRGRARWSSCPPCIPCRRAGARARGVGSEGEQAHLVALHGEDDVTIREYHEGDDLRHIHWPATARTGDLMVRQEDRPAQRRAVLLLDPRPAAHGGSGATGSFEWAVTAVASVAAHLFEAGFSVHLVCAETVASSRAAETLSVTEILDVLAVAAPLADSGSDDILRAAQTLAGGGGLVVAVVGPTDPQATGRVASLRQPGTSALAFVLDAASFGDAPGADDVSGHLDTLRASGWRTVAVRRDDSVSQAWSVLTASTVGASR